MSSGMFRGKESSNRIELSRLVHDLLNFGVLGSLRLWGGGQVGDGGVRGIWGHGGVSPHTRTCTHTHAHADTHMYTCIEIANGRRHGGIHFSMISMFNMHVRACLHVRVCVHRTPPTPMPTPTPIHPSATPPGGWTPRISKNSITLELIKIFQFCLKI